MKDISQETFDIIIKRVEEEITSPPYDIFPHPKGEQLRDKIQEKFPESFDYMYTNVGEFFRSQDQYFSEEDLEMLFSRVMHLFIIYLRMMDFENNGKDIME